MGTPKRERQKANRQQRQIDEARAERVSSIRRNVLRVSVGIVVAIAAVVLIAWLGGAFDGDEEPDVALDDAADVTFAPQVTTVSLPKPDVEIPSEEPTELVITDLVAGTGDGAAVGDTVTVHYVGVLSADGTEFDNSYDRGTPFPVVLGSGGVIAGWEDGLLGVQEGARRQLDIPADLAYGDRGSPPVIEPGAALTFVIDVVSIEHAR